MEKNGQFITTIHHIKSEHLASLPPSALRQRNIIIYY